MPVSYPFTPFFLGCPEKAILYRKRIDRLSAMADSKFGSLVQWLTHILRARPIRYRERDGTYFWGVPAGHNQKDVASTIVFDYNKEKLPEVRKWRG
jgi:hypothetical protein